MIKLSDTETTGLFTLITSAQFDNSRILIAEHEIESEVFTLWLEDKYDQKYTLDECLKIEIPIASFEAFINEKGYNKYEKSEFVGDYPKGNFKAVTKTINEPLAWYREYATAYEQKTVREDLVLSIIKDQLVNVQC